MKDSLQMTRKQLKATAQQLNAEVVTHSSIYHYENALSDLLNTYYDEKIWVHCDIIAYSAGIYGNNGRIDHIYNEDNTINQFVCWY